MYKKCSLSNKKSVAYNILNNQQTRNMNSLVCVLLLAFIGISSALVYERVPVELEWDACPTPRTVQNFRASRVNTINRIKIFKSDNFIIVCRRLV